MKNEQVKFNSQKEIGVPRLKMCCSIFGFALGILLWLCYLKSLSTPMCPW